MSRSVQVEAPAKVNLFLRVLGRRPDGFHDIETLFQSISLADRVVVTVDHGASGASGLPTVEDRPIVLELRGSHGAGAPDLGPVEENLAFRAARRFRRESGHRGPIRVELEKAIPAGAGLGGGSSDAAAVLRCLAALTGFGDIAKLRAIALELGSDVPFFLAGSPLALGRGRGEELEELPPLPQAALVLALPDVHVSTGWAYAELAAGRVDAESAGSEGSRRQAVERAGDGGGYRSASAGREWSDTIEGARSADRDDLDWPDVVRRAHNDFEPIVARRHDEIRATLEGLRDEGASMALLSGSGAASFGIFETVEAADRARSALSGRHPWRFATATTRSTVPAPRPLGG